MQWRPVLAGGICVFMVVLSQLGRSQTQGHARLDYERADGVDGCPTERELKDAIAARLGYDPFDGGATHKVKVRVVRRGAGLVGRLEIEGPRRGEREIASPSADCRELLDSLAVAIAIGIDPTSLTRAPVESASASTSPGVLVQTSASEPMSRQEPAPVPPAHSVAVPPPVAVSSHPSTAYEVGALAGPSILLGELPAAAFGLSAGVVVRRGWSETGLLGHMTSSATRDGADGKAIEASLVGVTLTPCARSGVLLGCAIGSFGLLRTEGKRIDLPVRATRRFGGLGASVGLVIPLGGVWEGRVHVDGIVPLNVIHFDLDQQTIWTTPRVAARVSSEVAVRF